jgi:hypothetical protein
MKFPKFWALARSGNFFSWQWSDHSVEEARARANEAARRMEMQFNANGKPGERYGYANRPLREPVLRELLDSAGQVAHVITRNSYGCQVLNSERALFVDVDLPEELPKIGAIFGSLFGRRAAQQENPEQAALIKATHWAASRPGWNWRVYRTKAGLRLLATHALFDPADPICESVFAAVDADPLYRKLCQTQKCFRARLTPKPWRCDVANPPTRWPFADLLAERKFTDWNVRYQSACRLKATCQLLEKGTGQVHRDLRPLIDLHDEMTRATSSGLALA